MGYGEAGSGRAHGVARGDDGGEGSEGATAKSERGGGGREGSVGLGFVREEAERGWEAHAHA
jgi:hypothetical protein